MPNSPKAIAFAQAVRDAAAAAEIAYRRAKRLSERWTAGNMNVEFPAQDTTPLEDGNLTHPLTLGEARAAYFQLADLATDFEADNKRKLLVCMRAGSIPGDWR